MKLKLPFPLRRAVWVLAGLILAVLAGLSWLHWGWIQPRASALLSNLAITPTSQPTEPAPLPSPTPSQAAATPATESAAADPGQGALLLALRDGAHVHLFAYQPGVLPLTRLTRSDWDEVDPVVSPDGQQLAYASRQNGYWDLYVRDLETGKVQRVTDTPEYEGQPSWSPDGQWLACAVYRDNNLDIYLVPIHDPRQAAVRLTEDPAADSAPAWSPRGRQIAFVSTRSGKSEIWLADLDKNDASRFRLLSTDAQASASNPTWSRDGRYLAWSRDRQGSRELYVWDSTRPADAAVWAGYGDRPAWSLDGKQLYTLQEGPNQTALEAYDVASGRSVAPYTPLPGSAYGLSWKPAPIRGWLADAIHQGDTRPADALVHPVLSKPNNPPNGRIAVVQVPDISAPFPMLSDAVDEAFQSLRLQAANDSGWDVLSSLENAYLPLTSPSDPGIQDDWLYTGRAFALNPLILSAGWMSIAREDYNGQTYWHVYLKARFQDGSAGEPLSSPAWDVNARFAGDPQIYEQGGKQGDVPSGYWIDLTELARRYGWERLASRINWRTYFAGIRFNQFVYRDNLDWESAMRQLYPPEALATPTSVPTPTLTPTLTPEPTRTPLTPVPTPTITLTATRRPTLTPPP